MMMHLVVMKIFFLLLSFLLLLCAAKGGILRELEDEIIRENLVEDANQSASSYKV